MSAQFDVHTPPDSPAEIAAQLIAESGGDRDAATDRLAAIARRRPEWHHEIIRRWATALVGEAARSRNMTIRASSVPNTAATERANERARAYGGAAAESLLCYELRVNGKSVHLGDATAAQVAEVARRYMSQGSAMVRTGQWLQRIAAAVPDGKLVRQVFSARELGRHQSSRRKAA
ncbi:MULTISPECIES: hypothetical protein [unclassified Chelatococcus]|uniref:hypothetical protein n=1 Tax=unclassified Chelatococcus TaxID=2638111 RepID=UPI001BCA6957|nr:MULTISPECIES: hypothetical protein [unclassified Chelatococcus]MBS7737921.1 hypothetical protein [Chelatococcus sp. HY11]MCO5079375.1 hypothetical protein [Chelatococcus sp.]